MPLISDSHKVLVGLVAHDYPVFIHWNKWLFAVKSFGATSKPVQQSDEPASQYAYVAMSIS